jgi:hypothetical protein
LAFLKRHYEKILLAIFLVIFVIALFYQIEIITSKTKVTTSDLRLKPMTENYKALQVDFAGEQFKVNSIFLKDSSWTASAARTKVDKYFTDLLLPFPMVRCPHSGCQKIIARWLIINDPHECPFCHGELKTPAHEKPKGIIINPDEVTGKTDSDNGGIPDLEEKKYGLNPAQADDDGADLDGDGFANVYEFDQKTKMNDAKSHPPLYLRLYLDKLVKNKLNFTLKNIIIQGTNKADWDIQVNFGSNKTGFYWLDDMMKVDNREYKIIDLDAKKIKKKDGSIQDIKTAGSIKIKSADGKEVVTAVIGKDVFSPNPRAIIIDEANDRKYSMNIGDVIEIGSKKTGIKRYKVTDINSMKGKEAVTIIDLEDKKPYIIDSTLKIPKLKKEQTNFGGDEMGIGTESSDGMPGEMLPGGRPTQRRGTPRSRRRTTPKF